MNDTELARLLDQWSGESVTIQRDVPTGAWIIIAAHSTVLGPAGGGTRCKPYPSLTTAVADALRLAEAMTLKFATIGMAQGGGKAVLAVPEGLTADARHGLLQRYGGVVGRLGGYFMTGPDVGTTSADMDVIAGSGAPYIFGRTLAAGGAGESGPATAVGVRRAQEAVLAHLYGDDGSPAGRHVAIQGVGSVGGTLARLLAEAGAQVTLCDVDQARAAALADELGATAVAPDAIYDVAADIFAPCALGGVLDKTTIPRLRCRAVVGGANNQLATPDSLARLSAREILYMPDFVANSGGAQYVLLREQHSLSEVETMARIDKIGDTARRLLAMVATRGGTLEEAARALARQNLARARSGSEGE